MVCCGLLRPQPRLGVCRGMRRENGRLAHVAHPVGGVDQPGVTGGVCGVLVVHPSVDRIQGIFGLFHVVGHGGDFVEAFVVAVHFWLHVVVRFLPLYTAHLVPSGRKSMASPN